MVFEDAKNHYFRQANCLTSRQNVHELKLEARITSLMVLKDPNDFKSLSTHSMHVLGSHAERQTITSAKRTALPEMQLPCASNMLHWPHDIHASENHYFRLAKLFCQLSNTVRKLHHQPHGCQK